MHGSTIGSWQRLVPAAIEDDAHPVPWAVCELEVVSIITEPVALWIRIPRMPTAASWFLVRFSCICMVGLRGPTDHRQSSTQHSS
jgi:hypothetical protein